MANGCRCFFASLANMSPSTRDTAESQLTRRITSTADSEVRTSTDISHAEVHLSSPMTAKAWKVPRHCRRYPAYVIARSLGAQYGS